MIQCGVDLIDELIFMCDEGHNVISLIEENGSENLLGGVLLHIFISKS